MASIFDVISGLARKGNEAAQSTQAKTLVADVSKLAAEKKKKQAAIDASIKKAGVKPSVISAPSSAPIDTGLSDLAQKAQSFPQLEGLLPSNQPVSVQNEETKSIIQNLFSRIKKPVVDMGASAIQNLNPIAAFLNKTNVPFLKNAADYVGNKDKISGALSGAITGAIEQPASNLFESMQALRKKQEARTNTTMGDRINDLLSSGTMTAGAAISALPVAAQYNAVVGGLKGNEQTKGLGEGIDAATMAVPNAIGSGINRIPGLNEEQKGALSMLANLGLVTAGGKIGEGIGKRIDAGNLGRAANVVGKELTGNKATMFSGIDPTPFLKGVKEFAKNPIVQSLDPTGITGGIGNTNGIKQDPLIEEAKKYKSAEEFVKSKMVDAKGSSFVYQKNTPNNAYTFAEDGHVIKKGDLVKEYMNGSASFVEASTAGKVGKIVTNQAPYLVITPQTKQQLTDIYNKAQAGGEPPIPPVPPKTNVSTGGEGLPSREVVSASLNDRIDSFMQRTAGYSTKTPEAPMKKGTIGAAMNVDPKNPIVNDRTGETLNDAIQKLRNNGWEEKAITKYKDAILGKGKDKVKKVSNEKVLDSLNPTGGLLVDYTPQERASLPLGDNITTLDKTSGVAANDVITIYRGAPKSQKTIVAGDFITTSLDLAKSYAGEGHVISKKVKASHVIDDINESLGDEYIYRPDKKTTKKTIEVKQTTGIAGGIGSTDGIKQDPLIEEAKNKNDFNPEQYVKEQIAKREQAKKSETPSMKDRIMNTWSDIKTKLVDSTAPIEDILYRVKNKNKNNFSIPPSKDIHNQIDRVFRTTDITKKFMKDNGLYSIIRGVDNLDNLDQYLIAKHGQTLTKNGVETGRDPIKDASLVDSFAPKYEAQAKQVTEYSQKLLDYAVSTGLVSKETAQALKEKYPDYVPFNRVFNDDGTFNSIGGKSVANLSKQSVIQKIVGSKREVESPLQSLLQKTHEVFTQGEKNKAGKMLSEYSSFEGNPFQLKQIKEVKDASDGMGTVSFYKDGVKQIYETSPEIAQAAKSLGVQQLNILGKIFAAPVRIARIGITGLNIPFIGANIVKDNMSAFINSKNSLRTSVANPKVFIQSLLEAVGHGKLYQEMVGEGGGGTSFDMSRSNAGKTLEQIRAGRNIGSQIKYTITHPSQLVKAVEDIIARGEEFTRISQYKGTKDAMLAKGMSEKEARIEAARQARDTTVNFARKGEWGTVLNSAFLFLNANIQGTRTLMRRLKEDPIGTSTKIATVGLLPMAIATAWNLEDDKKKQVYDDIADYEKENNFIIIPENATKDEEGKWNVIKIPLSQDIKNLLNISRRLVEQAHGKDPVTFGEFAKSLLSTASPIGLDQQSLISTLTPQAIKPSIEAIQNKSLFTGLPIVPRSLEGKLPEDQVKDNTSGLARILGKQIGQSPIQVEQFIKSTFGGVGSQATNAVDTVLNKAGIIPSTQIGGQGILEGILGRFMKAQGGNIEKQQWEKEAQNKQLLLKNKIELTPERKAEVASFDQRKQQAKLERDRNTLLEIQKLAKDGTEEEARAAIIKEYPRLSPAAVSKIIKDTREGKVY